MSVCNPLPTGQTAIGYMNDRPDPAVPLDTITIPEDCRLHAMAPGATGSGKSTTFKMLRQNRLLGDGMAVLDPHHDLDAWTARRIPRWRANQLVYISPAHLERTGKAVPVNPLEGYGGAPAQAAEFAETLLKAFDTKGVQMHQILREAATSLIAAKRGGLGLLRRIILDKSLLRHYTRYGYTRMDAGETGNPMPDLEVCGLTGEPDPERWGRRVSIKVETGPGRHPNKPGKPCKPGKPGQVYANWAKSRRSMRVWFLVYNTKDKRIIHAQLDETGIKRTQYECSVISYDEIKAGTAIPLPPGFDPIVALPHRGDGEPLDMLLGIITEWIRVDQIRGSVPKQYGDRDVEAVDCLKRDGLVEGRRRGRSGENLYR